MIWTPSVLKSYDGGRPRPWYQQVKFWWTLFFLGNAALYWRFW